MPPEGLGNVAGILIERDGLAESSSERKGLELRRRVWEMEVRGVARRRSICGFENIKPANPHAVFQCLQSINAKVLKLRTIPRCRS